MNTLEDEFNKALSYAYRVLAYRRRTLLEMKARLEKKGFAPEVSNCVLDKLTVYGFLNDAAFARLWVEQRRMRRGIFGLKMELLEKGVDSRIVEQILSEINPAEEFNSALELAKKKMNISGGLCSPSGIADFLKRRGFSYEVIRKVCIAVADRELS